MMADNEARDPFFGQQAVKNAIKDLSSRKKLYLFLGAGTAMDRGHPAWDDLVEELLDRAIHNSSLDVDAKRMARDLLRHESDPLANASIARSILGNAPLKEVVKKIIYRDVRSSFGESAVRLVMLALAWRATDGECVIVTTNYDDSLERALKESSRIAGAARALGLTLPRPVPIWDPFQLEDCGHDDLPILHLHGFVPQNEGEWGRIEGSPHVVLSERDYAVTSIAGKWINEIVERIGRDDGTLVLGMGFRDPNVDRLIRGLATSDQASVAERHCYAVLTLLGAGWASAPDDVRKLAVDAHAERLNHLGVRPLPAEYFMQTSQLVNELTLARLLWSDGRDYGANTVGANPPEYGFRFGQRSAHWWGQRYRFLDRTDSTSFLTTQNSLYERIRAFRKRLTTAIGLDTSMSTERLKAELWVRNPEREELELWGSSETVARNRHFLPAQPISVSSPFSVVLAFCSGAASEAETRGGQSRWRFFQSWPLVLRADPWTNLPIGVISVASTESASTTRVKLYPESARNELEAFHSELEQYLGGTT